MLKTNQKIIILFFLLGVFLWLFDAIIDYFFFFSGQGTFSEILIFNPPGHEIYIRSSTLLLLTCLGFIFSHYIRELKQSKTRLQNIFNNVIPICITNSEYEIIGTNSSYDTRFGSVRNRKISVKCYEERPGRQCKEDGCPVVEILKKNKELYTCDTVKSDKEGSDHHYIVTATPYLDLEGNKAGIIETFQDITPRKQLEKEKEKLINNLQEALAQVKVLSGFLPICASCKKIRDDKGYWTQIETYIRNHSEAEFSHGICPDCAEKNYGYTKN